MFNFKNQQKFSNSLYNNMNKIEEIISIWKNELKNKNFKSSTILTVIIISIVLFLVTKYLSYNELRDGFVIKDPILSLFNPIDVTWITFIIMYSAIPFTIISLLKDPRSLIFALQIYIFMISFRITGMFLLPLNPPETIIILQDPFIAFFSTGMTFTKDLFFSGHTATMFLMYLVVKNKIIKTILLICTISIGVLVLIQHVHYSIDVFASPFFTYVAYVIAKKINLKYS